MLSSVAGTQADVLATGEFTSGCSCACAAAAAGAGGQKIFDQHGYNEFIKQVNY